MDLRRNCSVEVSELMLWCATVIVGSYDLTLTQLETYKSPA